MTLAAWVLAGCLGPRMEALEVAADGALILAPPMDVVAAAGRPQSFTAIGLVHAQAGFALSEPFHTHRPRVLIGGPSGGWQAEPFRRLDLAQSVAVAATEALDLVCASTDGLRGPRTHLRWVDRADSRLLWRQVLRGRLSGVLVAVGPSEVVAALGRSLLRLRPGRPPRAIFESDTDLTLLGGWRGPTGATLFLHHRRNGPADPGPVTVLLLRDGAVALPRALEVSGAPLHVFRSAWVLGDADGAMLIDQHTGVLRQWPLGPDGAPIATAAAITGFPGGVTGRPRFVRLEVGGHEALIGGAGPPDLRLLPAMNRPSLWVGPAPGGLPLIFEAEADGATGWVAEGPVGRAQRLRPVVITPTQLSPAPPAQPVHAALRSWLDGSPPSLPPPAGLRILQVGPGRLRGRLEGLCLTADAMGLGLGQPGETPKAGSNQWHWRGPGGTLILNGHREAPHCLVSVEFTPAKT